MELSVLERGLLLNVLPREGNLWTLKVVHELRMALGFDEAELEALDFRPTPDGQGQMWNDTVAPKEIAVGEKAKKIILEGIADLDKKSKLTMEYLPLCERFGYEGEKE